MTGEHFLVRFFDKYSHIITPATAATTIRPICRKCGTITKSAKNSCCGRGGSWFRNCGSTGNAKLRHTWYEGIQACKTRAQSKRASGRQSNGVAQSKRASGRLNSSNGVDARNSKGVMRTSKAFEVTPANTSISIAGRITSSKPANTSMNNSTATPDDTYTEYDSVKANYKTITMTPTTIISTSANTPLSTTSTTNTMSTIAAAHYSTLTTTATTTMMGGTIVAKVVVAQTVKEAAIATDRISQGMCYARNLS